MMQKKRLFNPLAIARFLNSPYLEHAPRAYRARPACISSTLRVHIERAPRA